MAFLECRGELVAMSSGIQLNSFFFFFFPLRKNESLKNFMKEALF